MAQRFYNHILGNWGNSPFFCEPWLVEQIIDQHFYSPSMLAVFPIQDLLAIDDNLRYKDTREERINIPANPQHYWRYRMHMSIEALVKEKDFNQRVLSKVKDSGRFGAY
jgi:4-alpha-glucanotransferase